MGLRKGRGTLDPRLFRHTTPVFEGDMIALIEFTESLQEGEAPVWNEEEERWEEGPSRRLWRGMARVAPNKDWRARTREYAMESTADHAVRVQMNLYKNFLVPRAEWPADPVDIRTGNLMRVIVNPNDPVLQEYRFTVRNAIGATDNWHRTILCDANLGGRYGTST